MSPDGIPIVFDVDGAGDRTLVFVHGWSCDRSYWAQQIPALAPRYRVVAIDLAGHGESGVARPSWTMPAYGGDVAAVVEQLGLTDVVLIGHSMGGDVVVEAALRLGDRVHGLVWVDVYRSLSESIGTDDVEVFLAGFRRDFVGEVQQFVRGFFLPTSDPALIERVVADMSSAPRDIALDEMRHAIMNEGPAIAGLRTLRAPIVAINPGYRPTDEASLLRFGVRAVIIPDVGHMLMLEDPERFNATLGEVVAGFA
jgi:pimeloyl-ACP methyl ester carboxylesterase